MKIKVIFISIVTLFLSACASNPATGPSYYLLSSSELTQQKVQLQPFTLAVGPIDLPRYFDREGIVRHESENKLSYSATHRWAEPVTDTFNKVLFSNLQQLLPQQQLISFPYRRAAAPDYQLAVAVEKFGYTNSGSVVLDVRVNLTNGDAKQLDSKVLKLERSNVAQDYDLVVSNMSQLMSELALALSELLTTNLKAS